MNDISIAFNTNDLACKWGFEDGDILNPYVDNYTYMKKLCRSNCEGYASNHHALIKVVKFFILPKIDQKIIVKTFHSSHNPIRLDDEKMTDSVELTPYVVNVKLKDIESLLIGNAWARFKLYVRRMCGRL